MRNRQGTRRVYLKENFYEDTFSSLPSRCFVHVYGDNEWQWSNTHPDTNIYEPWDSCYHHGNNMEPPGGVGGQGAGYHCCRITRTSTKLDNTAQPYVDIHTGDGGLEPVIFEFMVHYETDDDITFLFFYDNASSLGMGVRMHDNGSGTGVIDIVTVNNTTAGTPTFTVQKSYAIDYPDYDWRCIRLYYTPVTTKYGGDTIGNAGHVQLFVSDGDSTDRPWDFLEGENTSATSYNYNDSTSYLLGSFRTSGDSLGWIKAPGGSGAVKLGTIKYTRHWDYGLTSVYCERLMTLPNSFMNVVLAKPQFGSYDTSNGAQIGYEYGDRIELQIKSHHRTYADPTDELFVSSHIEFDGYVADILDKGKEQDRATLTCYDFAQILVKDFQHFTFIASSNILDALQSLAPFGTYRFQASPWNGYGIDTGISGTFAGAKDFKGLANWDAMYRMVLLADCNCFWHPNGTWVVSSDFPDTGETIDTEDATYNQQIFHYAIKSQGSTLINRVDVYGSGSTRTREDSNSQEYYGPSGMPWFEPRDANTTDLDAYGDNIVNRYKHRRKILEIQTQAGLCWYELIQKCEVTIRGLEIDGVDFQLIGKTMAWGERFTEAPNTIKFLLCEYIDASTPSIWLVGKDEQVGQVKTMAREGLGGHA